MVKQGLKWLEYIAESSSNWVGAFHWVGVWGEVGCDNLYDLYILYNIQFIQYQQQPSYVTPYPNLLNFFHKYGKFLTRAKHFIEITEWALGLQNNLIVF